MANGCFSYCPYSRLEMTTHDSGNFLAYEQNYTIRQKIDDEGPPSSNLHFPCEPITMTSPDNLFYILLFRI